MRPRRAVNCAPFPSRPFPEAHHVRPAKNPLARRAHGRLDWLDVTSLVCIGGEGDRRHDDDWIIRFVHAVSRSRGFHEPSGKGKRNRASSGNVRAMTQDYLRYMEPGSDAVMRKHGEGGCCHWRSRTRRTRRGRAHASVACAPVYRGSSGPVGGRSVQPRRSASSRVTLRMSAVPSVPANASTGTQ